MNDRPELEIIEEVRTLLSKTNFQEQEIWRLMGSNLTLAYWSGQLTTASPSVKEICFLAYYILLNDFVYFFKKISKARKKIFVNNKAVFIEALSNEPRLSKLWLPVAQKFTNEHAALITDSDAVFDLYKSRFHVLFPVCFSLKDWCTSRWFILRHVNKWQAGLLHLEKNKKLGKGRRFTILSLLVLQLNLSMKARWLYTSYKPKAFVTAFDWYYMGSAFCNVASFQNTKTFTFIHGAMGRQSFADLLPLNADFIFSWGRHNTKLLIDNGVAKEKILESGIQRLSRFVPPSLDYVAHLKQKLNLTSRSILLPFTAVLTHYWKQDVNLIIKALPQFHFILRPHPSTPVEEVSSFIAEASNFSVLNNNQLSLADAILVSDYVIIDSSTAGFEAILMDKDVLVVDSAPTAKMQDVMLDVCEAGAAIFVTDAREVSNIINKLQNDADFGGLLKSNREKFIEEYIVAFDVTATANVVDWVNKLAG